MSADMDEKTVSNEHDASSQEPIDNEYFRAASKSTGKKLPAWLDHFNPGDLKILFKCSLAAWIITVFIVINPVLKVVGQASFFGILVIFIAPPSGVVFIGVMIGVMLMFGICLGWTWGVITMKAALATRPAADLQRQYRALQEAATRNTTYVQQASGQATFQQVAIFEGFMLDTRVTVTYFCMIGLFIYLVARLRVGAPKLIFVQMFSTIIIDIFLTTGPLLPTFNGTIPRTLIIPAGIGIGVSLVCNVLFFPKSTQHIVLEDMAKMLKPMGTLLDATLIHFRAPARKMDLAKLKATKAQISGVFSSLEGNLKFLPLDFSVSRWSAGDVKSLHDPLRQVLIRFFGLLQTHVTRLEYQLKDQQLLEAAEHIRSGKNQDASGGHQIGRTFDLRSEMRPSVEDGVRKEVLRGFSSDSQNLLSSCQQALLLAVEIIEACNSKNWIGKLLSKNDQTDLTMAHKNLLRALKMDREQFPAKVASDLWDKYTGMNSNNEDAKHESGASNSQRLNGLVYVLVMEERIFTFAETLESLLGRLISLEENRKKARVWLPSSFKNVIPWALETTTNDPDQEPLLNRIETVSQNSDGSARKKRRFGKREAPPATSIEVTKTRIVARQGGRQRSKISGIAVAVSHWFGSTEGLFALRLLVVTMGLAVIAVNRNTAGFFYREKGLWALIMAQTGLTPYTADFMYGVGLRLGGTIIGAVVGLAAWYIGAGNGPGNPYGIAAIMVPIIVVLMWMRLFANPAFMQGIILTTATVYLVVAYSWVDTHIPSYGNPGVGYEVFWRRMLLVVVGFGAAAFVTIFPRPPSMNRHYRRVLSNAIQTNKDQYALFIAARSESHEPAEVRKLAGQTALAQNAVLAPLEQQAKLLKLEISSSRFDAESLSLVCHLCMNLNQYITQLTIYSAGLSIHFKERFFAGTGAADERSIADVMAVLTLIQHALRNSDPLPAILPVPLMERLLKNMKQRLDGMELNFEDLKQDVLENHEVRQYFSAVAAFIQFLGAVDELVLVVKRAVGETNHIDLEA